MVKRILNIFAICTIILVAVSCKKDELKESQNNGFSITASFVDNSNNSKVSFTQDESTHKLTPSWDENDRIVGTINNEPAEFIVVSVGESGRAILTTSSTINENDVINVIFAPGVTSADAISNGKIDVDLSSISTDNPKGLNAIMYASATAQDGHVELEFNNITSVLEISSISDITGSTVSKVIVSGSAVYNKTTINLADGTFSESTKGDIIYKFTNPQTITDNKLDGKFFAVILPGSGDIDVYVKTNTNVCKSTITGKTFVPSKCYYTKRSVKSIPVFTVADNKPVIFAPGNLVYTHPDNWGFAENQTTVILNKNGNIKNGTYANGDKIDLFTWSSSSNKGGLNVLKAQSSIGSTFYDWGNLVTGYSPNHWYTLSKTEWDYLLANNANRLITNSGNHYIVIGPDGMTQANLNGFANINTCISNGCLVLPHCGLRQRSSDTVADVSPTDVALYSSSTYSGKIAQGDYCSWQINSDKKDRKYDWEGSVADGVAVRLAHAF